MDCVHLSYLRTSSPENFPIYIFIFVVIAINTVGFFAMTI